MMTVGLKTVRELVLRCPLVMEEDLLTDLAQYKKFREKQVGGVGGVAEGRRGGGVCVLEITRERTNERRRRVCMCACEVLLRCRKRSRGMSQGRVCGWVFGFCKGFLRHGLSACCAVLCRTTGAGTQSRGAMVHLRLQLHVDVVLASCRNNVD